MWRQKGLRWRRGLKFKDNKEPQKLKTTRGSSSQDYTVQFLLTRILQKVMVPDLLTATWSIRKILFWVLKGKADSLTLLSVSVEATRWNACKECGNSRGAIGSQEPWAGALILIRMCQLEQGEK